MLGPLPLHAGASASGSREPSEAPAQHRHLVPLPTTPLPESGGRADPHRLGTQLFECVFSGEVLSLLDQSLGTIHRSDGVGLRIRVELDLKDPYTRWFSALPWELLHRPGVGDSFALSRRTPIVRYLDVARPLRELPLPSPLRILVVPSAPRGLPALRIQEELRELVNAWKGIPGVRVVTAESAKLELVREAVLASPVHVIHFMGHGALEEAARGGVLFFEGEQGEPRPISGSDLTLELKDAGELRLVVLNACETALDGAYFSPASSAPPESMAAALVQGGLPAVIAMRSPISDQAALLFSQTIYQRLAKGDPVDTAVTEGRLAIRRNPGGDAEWATPVLFMRVPDGRLFDPTPRSKPRQHSRPWLLAPLALTILLALALLPAVLGERTVSPEGPPVADGCGQRVEEEVRVLAEQGLTLGREGRHEEARAALHEAAERAPAYAAPHLHLSEMEERRGRYGPALSHARAAVARVPDCALAQYDLGRLYSTLSRHEEALESLHRALEINPAYIAARNEIANVYLALDRPLDALGHLEDAVEMAPVLPELHKNIGRAALGSGDASTAVAALDRALELYPPDDWLGLDETSYWLAAAYAVSDRSLEACASLARFQGRERPPLTEWERGAAEIGRRLDCASTSRLRSRVEENG